VTTVAPLTELSSLIGRRLGPSAGIEVTQERIDAFAACTLDPQWIHVDPERAAEGPFGRTIAHGFLTLSMLSHVMEELLRVTGAGMAINYGLNRVRFPSPVPSGSTIRATVTVLTVIPAEDHVMMTAEVSFAVDGTDRPCCVAESVTRFVRAA
jgi:acyl dehydratase